MMHSFEMWLDRDGDRRLAHVEMDVDMSLFPKRFAATSFRAWLSGEWVELELSDAEMIQAVQLGRRLLQERQTQIAVIEHYEDHVQKC